MSNSVDYHAWQSGAISIAGARYRYATKPGAFAHGAVDPAQLLLAQYARVSAGDTVLQLNCGNGLFGAVAATTGQASRVLLSDRNVVSFGAAVRTLEANGAGSATAWLGHGTHMLPSGTQADVVAIRIPHEKVALLQLLWDGWSALRVGGRCVIAGATNEGAKSAARLMELLFGASHLLASESGFRIVSAVKLGAVAPVLDEFATPLLDHNAFHRVEAKLRGMPITLFTRPGVFSWEHLDEATEILAEQMHVHSGADVLDLGCGSGALGVVAGQLSGTGRITMVDADSEAVRAAQRSGNAGGLADVQAVTSDIADAVRDERFDVVVSNPPFHVGKATALNVPMQFMRDAFHVLRPGGRLLLVANRTLPYEAALTDIFGNMRTVHDGQRFKVLSATRS